jgi:hypothetical protein
MLIYLKSKGLAINLDNVLYIAYDESYPLVKRANGELDLDYGPLAEGEEQVEDAIIRFYGVSAEVERTNLFQWVLGAAAKQIWKKIGNVDDIIFVS